MEELGHKVIRFQEWQTKIEDIKKADYDILLFAKFRVGSLLERTEFLKNHTKPKICWIPDLFFGMNNDEEI